MIQKRSLRDLATLVETGLHTELDENGAGPARIIQHIRNGAVFIMISAMRGDRTRAENLKRTEKLKQVLTRMAVSFIETGGEYHEDGQDEPSEEKSFFIMPRRGTRTLSPKTFRAFGMKLMHGFQQDSILFGDGHIASLIFGDGSEIDLGDTVTFRPEIIKNLGGFSKIKGRPFSFTSRSTAKQDHPHAGTTYGNHHAAMAA
jgi:hypothetical protein